MNEPPFRRPPLGFWELSWLVVSRIGAVVLFVAALDDPRVGFAFVGLSILIAAHAISRAIRESH